MDKDNDRIFCSKCGSENNKYNLFCSNCGNKLIQDKSEDINNGYKSINKNTTSDYLHTNEMDIFILKNIEYYNSKFKQIVRRGNKKTWNWSAFLCGKFWFLYRKMYVQAIILFFINEVVSLIPHVGTIINLVLEIIIGIYANSVYFDHINKKLSEIDMIGYETKESIIITKGGTNLIIPLLIIGIYALIFIFMFILLWNIV